ncbi:sigma-70 family RNA polymerase sigma factor [Hymenobacter sp. 5516J-16]|uniref:Sigma-70 family RNA polymerase sigma factor n=1 Tax=Hymenobacter sublimis TaxID=2933777 RepID=A0ABY4JAQ8_9BACT|nr:MULTISPECIES: sigma-70 family RNA polymerase sigma factor [Hymenobacter]UOQ78935.1 sigma-70 family RNA polymerase sigma factor [Hymenobacter sp. 5516J-16]UPL48896.1 sigma-70 family RNA polymerase sigma factor [Hymenobacter sublimis]
METIASLRHALLTDRHQTLTGIYQRTFPMVRRHVQQRGGSAQDAKDVFQDALVIFYEKAVGETLVLSASVSTYLVGVCRNLWRRELSRRSQQPLTGLMEEHGELPEDPETAETPAALSVLDYVEQLGERCKSVLLAFYYFQQPLEQIARTHDYRSVRSATVQKFKCLERLRASVRAVFAHDFDR